MGKKEALQAIGPKLILPTLPDVVAKINVMIVDPSCGPQEIGRVVASDAALTAKVLSIANSSFYGLQERVLTAEQAATVIGATSLRNIAMQVTVVQRYEHLASFADFDLDQLWDHTIQTAQLCQLLGAACNLKTRLTPDEFFTCGLLHDVGKVVLLESLGAAYIEVLLSARQKGVSLHSEEQRILGFTHVDVGALVAARWKLPSAVSLSIAYHHGPKQMIVENPAVAAVAIADQLSYRSACAGFESSLEQLEEVAVKILKVTPQAFESIVASLSGAASDLAAA